MKTTLLYATIGLLLFPKLICAQEFNIPEICSGAAFENTQSALKHIFKEAPDLHLGMDPDVFAKELFKRFGSSGAEAATTSWLLLSSPLLSDRIAAHKLQLLYAKELLEYRGQTLTVFESIEKDAKALPQYSEKALNEHRAFIDEWIATPSFVGPALTEALVDMACALEPFGQCRTSILEVVETMHTNSLLLSRWGTAALSLPDVVDDVFSSPLYRQASAKLALTIQRKIETLDPKDPKANLGFVLDDTIQAFLESGAEPQEARRHAYRLMGFYGSRGASLRLMEFGTSSESWGVFASLFVVSTGMGVLDLYAGGNSHPYSYAPNVTTHCAHGRPYHFWLPAYLSWDLQNKGYKPRTALLATHTMGNIYEFGGDLKNVGIKDNTHIYYGEYFNNGNVNTQENLAINDIGAEFAMTESHHLSVDTALTSLFEAGLPMPDLSPEEITRRMKIPGQKFHWYNRVIAPNAYVEKKYLIAPHH